MLFDYGSLSYVLIIQFREKNLLAITSLVLWILWQSVKWCSAPVTVSPALISVFGLCVPDCSPAINWCRPPPPVWACVCDSSARGCGWWRLRSRPPWPARISRISRRGCCPGDHRPAPPLQPLTSNTVVRYDEKPTYTIFKMFVFISRGCRDLSTLNVASASVVLTMSCAKEIFHLIIFQAHKGAGSFHH